ncbi:hypothetical protein F5887DRAFT_155943 [Amanita rubescens]|nr:hypothetical protein F5887DRAFT_155943 [Amanita rubescens]
MSRISPKQAHRRFIAMKTITVHANNQATSSLLHKRTSAILSPVSERYSKPQPWWIHEFGLTSIEETNQEAEGVMDVHGIEEQDKEVGEKQEKQRLDGDEPTEDFSPAGEVEIFVDAKFLPEGVDYSEHVEKCESKGGAGSFVLVENCDATFDKEDKDDYDMFKDLAQDVAFRNSFNSRRW